MTVAAPDLHMAGSSRRFLRFSLRTLVVFVLLVGSGFGLWWRWEPWVLHWRCDGSTLSASSDSSKIAVIDITGAVELKDAASGATIGKFKIPSHKWDKIRLTCEGTRLLARKDSHCSVWDAYTGRTIIETDNTSFWWYFSDLFVVVPKQDKLAVLAAADGSVVAEVPHARIDGSYDDTILRLLKGRFGRSYTEYSMGEILGAWDTNTWRRLSDFETEQALRLQVFLEEQSVVELDGTYDNQVPQFNSAKTRAVTLYLNRHALLLDLENKRIIRTLRSDLNTWRVTGFAASAFSADGRFVALAAPEGTLLSSADDGAARWSTDLPGAAICFAPDGERLAQRFFENITILDAKNGRTLATPSVRPPVQKWLGNQSIAFLGNDVLVVVRAEDSAEECSCSVWHRRRPEYKWGVAWLPEFWATLVFAAGLGWSIRRDRRRLGKQPA
jgi:hypothetical protein